MMMKFLLVAVLIAVTTCNASTSWRILKIARPSSESFSMIYPEVHDKLEKLWKIFKEEFNKNYSDTLEEVKRYFIFAQTYIQVMQHNIRYEQGKETYMLSINSMADMTSQEYNVLRAYKAGFNHKLRSSLNISSGIFVEPLGFNYPRNMDWRKKGAVTPVKNQGQCGSCWAFSTTGSLEGQQFRKSNKLLSLSEQQLVDCASSFGNHGCDGGLMDLAFEYIKKVGGIETEEDYPYISGDTHEPNDRCEFKREKEVAEVTGFIDITSGDEDALMKALAINGPISIAIDASRPSFQMYHGGIYNDLECKNGVSDLDHGVLVVGYGSEDGQDYWIIKNSWGPEWGEKGYIRIIRNKGNRCGVATAASFPLV